MSSRRFTRAMEQRASSFVSSSRGTPMPPNTQHAQAESRGDDSRSNSKLLSKSVTASLLFQFESTTSVISSSLSQLQLYSAGAPTIQQQLFVLLGAILSLDCVPTFVLARRLD